MPELSVEERIKLAVKFIAQAPPGEVNDVVNDIRAIVNDDGALMPHAAPALREYNLAQMQVVQHAGEGAHKSLLSEATILPGTSGEKERYVDATAGRSFAFDHVSLLASEYEPYELPEEEATFRAALEKSLEKYARNHYPDGVWGVTTSQFALVPKPPTPESEPEREQVAVAAPVGESAIATGRDETTHEGEAQGAALEAQGAAETDHVPTPLDSSDAMAVDTPAPAAADLPTPAEQNAEGIAEEFSTPLGSVTPRGAEDEVDAPGGVQVLDNEIAAVQKEGDDELEREEAEKRAAAMQREDAEVERIDHEMGDEFQDAQGEPLQDGQVQPSQLSQPTSSQQVESDLGRENPHEEEETTTRGAETILGASVSQSTQQHVDNPTYTLEIVGNRYNPANFWTGRWRTRWVVDPAAGSVDGVIKLDVHYYEQGNVQLSTEHKASFPLPTEKEGQSVASQIVTSLARVETEYQLEMGEVYETLGEKAFRSLRRALPVTRQKIDWDKVSGYSLGADLSKAR